MMRSAFSNPSGLRGLSRLTIIILFIAVLVIALVASDALLTLSGGSKAPAEKCDATLLTEERLQATGLCLEDLQITIPVTNTSEAFVPVVIVNPGTVTRMEILYQLSAESVQHPGPKQNVSSDNIPTIRSVPSGNVSSLVKFSVGTLVYQSSSLEIYSYNLTASPGSDGYYAILPIYYFGLNPVLAVGASPGHLNQSALSTWGYDGQMISAEFMLPSYLVGTGDATLVNATVPTTQICPSAACNIIAHSG
jgi:hypothetical protein